MNVVINSIVKGLITSTKTVDIEAIVGSLKDSRGHGSQEEGRLSYADDEAYVMVTWITLLSNTLFSS